MANLPQVPGRRSSVNFNDRVLDSVRSALGIPRSYEYGLDVPNSISPVVVIDPDSPPIMQNKGWLAGQIAASAANFSGLAVQNVGGAGGILRVQVSIIKTTAGVAYNLRLNQGAETTYSGAGWSAATTPYEDSRFPIGGSGVAQVWSRNNNAAAWAPAASNVMGVISATLLLGSVLKLPPVFLDQFDAFTIESSAINNQVDALIEWEYYAQVK